MSPALVGIRPERRDAYDEIVLVMHAPVWGKPRHLLKQHDDEAFVLESVEDKRSGRMIVPA